MEPDENRFITTDPQIALESLSCQHSYTRQFQQHPTAFALTHTDRHDEVRISTCTSLIQEDFLLGMSRRAPNGSAPSAMVVALVARSSNARCDRLGRLRSLPQVESTTRSSELALFEVLSTCPFVVKLSELDPKLECHPKTNRTNVIELMVPGSIYALLLWPFQCGVNSWPQLESSID